MNASLVTSWLASALSQSHQPSACIASLASIARIRRVGTRQELSPTSSTIPVERPSATAIDRDTDPPPSGVPVGSNTTRAAIGRPITAPSRVTGQSHHLRIARTAYALLFDSFAA